MQHDVFILLWSWLLRFNPAAADSSAMRLADPRTTCRERETQARQQVFTAGLSH